MGTYSVSSILVGPDESGAFNGHIHVHGGVSRSRAQHLVAERIHALNMTFARSRLIHGACPEHANDCYHYRLGDESATAAS